MTETEYRPDKPFTALAPALALVLAAALLSACAAPSRPAPVEERAVVEEQVRQPAQSESAGVQVYPLKNPAVAELTEQAERAERSGDADQAAVLLERALRIQPRDPELLQHMAEVQLQRREYEQALGFATRSFDIGPRVGEICARNWRTIGVARERLGDGSGAGAARARVEQCMVTRPRGL